MPLRFFCFQGAVVLGRGAGWLVLVRCRAVAGAWGELPCALARGTMCCAARWWRAPAAPLALLAVPGGRGCAPLSPDPYPRQAELAGFCALRARAGCAGARGDPPVCAGAWGDVLHGALVARSCRAARFARGPQGRGATRPYPRTPPTRGKLSLQAFARYRARAALRAGVFCAGAWCYPYVCAGACSDPPWCFCPPMARGSLDSKRDFE